MLHQVLQYAATHGLVSEEGFVVRKSIKWLLSLDSHGKHPTVIPPGDDGAFPPKLCPDAGTKALGDSSHFIVDKLSVVACYVGEDEPALDGAKHEYFVDQLQRASSVMPLLAVAAQALSDADNLSSICRELKKHGAKKSDFVSLRVGDINLVESEHWREWWRNEYRAQRTEKKPKKNTSTKPRMRCVLTGELIDPVDTHESKIQGLARYDGRGTGDSLIAFDKNAFSSYGLKGALNAATSGEIAKHYATALNHLIQNHSAGIANTLVTYWYKKQVKTQDEDILPWLTSSAESLEVDAMNQARRLFLAVEKGEKPDLLSNSYYSMILSGCKGRVMVRAWDEGEFTELVSGLRSWFDDLEITAIDGRSFAKWPTLEGIITSLLPPRKGNQKYADWIKPVSSYTPSFWKTALRGKNVPGFVVARIVAMLGISFIEFARTEPELSPEHKRERALQLSLLYRRMGLLKAYFIRNKEDNTMSKCLNPDHPLPAYHCGRVLAIFSRLQREALGDVGAGVVQRYYTAASQTPGLIIGRLAANAKNHLNKLPKAEDAREYEQKIAEVMCQMNEIPRTLTLEQQSLFALGYYQQLAELNAK